MPPALAQQFTALVLEVSLEIAPSDHETVRRVVTARGPNQSRQRPWSRFALGSLPAARLAAAGRPCRCGRTSPKIILTRGERVLKQRHDASMPLPERQMPRWIGTRASMLLQRFRPYSVVVNAVRELLQLTPTYEQVEGGWTQAGLVELPGVITAAPSREEARTCCWMLSASSSSLSDTDIQARYGPPTRMLPPSRLAPDSRPPPDSPQPVDPGSA